MRGKLLGVALCADILRITPAHAGKTGDGLEDRPQGTDHPRACGENSVFLCLQPLHLGSPPRMRGKPNHKISSLVAQRITPAHAGKTTVCRRLGTSWTDHPRACGENSDVAEKSKELLGSPPRMRGKLIDYQVVMPRSRITPAHAGKTQNCCGN